MSETVALWVMGILFTALFGLVATLWATMTNRVNGLVASIKETEKSLKQDHSDTTRALWKQIDKHRDSKADKAELAEIKADLKDVREHILAISKSMAEVSQSMGHIANEVSELRKR